MILCKRRANTHANYLRFVELITCGATSVCVLCVRRDMKGAHPSHSTGHFHTRLDRQGALISLSRRCFDVGRDVLSAVYGSAGVPIQWQLRRLWVTPPQRQSWWHTYGHLATMRPASMHKSSRTSTRRYTALSKHQPLQSQWHERQEVDRNGFFLDWHWCRFLGISICTADIFD